MTEQHPEITQERLDLWRKSYAPDASDVEFQTFVEIVSRTALSPEARQIYLTGRFDKRKGRNVYTVLTGIDGYRLVADRTGKYAGNDDPIFDNERNPAKASVTVYKLVGGVRCAFTASARWDQYYPGDAQGFMWKKMPHLMLGKCAEALALRKAFPAELSGLYTNEEMEQAGAEPAPAVVDKGKLQEKREQRQVDAAAARTAQNAVTDRTYETDDASRIYRNTVEDWPPVKARLEDLRVPSDFWREIITCLKGRPVSDLDTVIADVRDGSIDLQKSKGPF